MPLLKIATHYQQAGHKEGKERGIGEIKEVGEIREAPEKGRETSQRVNWDRACYHMLHNHMWILAI